MTSAYARWVAVIERRHRAILLGSLLLTALAALSLAALRFDFDVLGMLPSGAPAFDNFKRFVAEFGELNELVVLVDTPDAAARGRFADAFAARLQRLDTVEAVHGKLDLPSLQQGLLGRYRYNFVPLDAYAQLAAQLTADGIAARLAADRAVLQAPFDLSAAQWVRRDPLGIGRLAAESLRAAGGTGGNLSGGYVGARDGAAVLLNVRPRQNAFDLAFTTRFMNEVRAAEAAARQETAAPASLRVGYTGSYAFALEDAATLKADVARYTLLALAGVLAVFYGGYRNLRILPFVTYPLVLSTLLTFAASLLCYAQLNAVSISFAAILYGLSIDSGIHYYTRLLQELRAHDRRTAVTRTLSHLGGASTVASATTAAAFFVIGFSRLTGVSQLGFLTAIGMLVNIAEFFVLYPALSFWMARGSVVTPALETPRLGRLAGRAAGAARRVLALTAVAGIALLAAARGARLDVDLTHLRPSDTPAGAVQDEIARRFGTNAAAGAVLVQAGDVEAALRTSEALERQLARYRAQGLVQSVHGITTLLPSAQTQRRRLAAFRRLPRAQIAADLRAALARQGFVVEQFDGFIDDFLAAHREVITLGAPELEPLAAIVARHVQTYNGHVTVATYIEPAAGVGLQTVADRLHRDLPDAAFVVTGRPLLEAALARLLSGELAWFWVGAFSLNLLLVLARFRRPALAMAILLPEVLVIVACLALMHLAGIGIDLVNLIVGPLILGIGVDNCVYIAERYRRGEPADEALREGGRALAISALTTTAGFGFLGLSSYPALAHLGALAALSLLLCFGVAVSVLPALLETLVPARRSAASPD